MLSHVTIGANDMAKAKAFYDACLGALGYGLVAEYDGEAVAYAAAPNAGPWTWVMRPFDDGAATFGNGTHFAFLAETRAAVDAFYAAALAHGGSDEGAPGPRPQYSEHYYGAYVRDPDGNKLQAVCRAPAAT